MMKTWSPTSARSELPNRATGAVVGTRSSWSRETSASGSEAITRAFTTSPPRNSAVISSAVCTTWAAVITLPSGEIRTPEPTSLTRPIWPEPPTSFQRARMMTTDGLTRLKVATRPWASTAGAGAMTSASRRPRAIASCCASEQGVDEPAERGLVEGGGLTAGGARLGLEPGLAHDDADGGVGVERPGGHELPQHRESGHPGRAGPDPLGPREQALRLEDLLVLRVAGQPARLLQDAEDPLALAPRVAGRKSLVHRVADLHRREWAPLAPRPRDRVGPGGLRGDHAGAPRDPAEALHLHEAAVGGDERLAHRGGGHHHVRDPPPRPLRDLVGERLLALVLVGVAGGAAVEEEPILDEAIPQDDQVVVHALVEDEVGGGRRHVQELGRRGARVGEDQPAQAGARGVGGDRRARVAGADHRGGAEAELERGRHRGGGGAILHGAGGVRALELHHQAPHSEGAPESRTVEQRALPLSERDPMGRIGDGQHRGVAPEPPALEDPRPGAAKGRPVVFELEEAPAGRALEPVVERELRAALDAPQRGRERDGGHRRIASISSMRWRRVCSARARLRARSPMSRASSGWAR